MAQVKTGFYKHFNAQVADTIAELGFSVINDSVIVEDNSRGYFHYVVKMADSELALWILDDSNLVHKLQVFFGFWDARNKMFVPFRELASIRHHKAQEFDKTGFLAGLREAIESAKEYNFRENVNPEKRNVIAELIFNDRYRQEMTRQRESAIRSNEIAEWMESDRITACYAVICAFLKGIDPQGVNRVLPVKNGRKYMDLYRIIANHIFA